VERPLFRCVVVGAFNIRSHLPFQYLESFYSGLSIDRPGPSPSGPPHHRPEPAIHYEAWFKTVPALECRISRTVPDGFRTSDRNCFWNKRASSNSSIRQLGMTTQQLKLLIACERRLLEAAVEGSQQRHLNVPQYIMKRLVFIMVLHSLDPQAPARSTG
jgi:hypothetical protein